MADEAMISFDDVGRREVAIEAAGSVSHAPCHLGSARGVHTARLASRQGAPLPIVGAAAIAMGIAAGNINVSTEGARYRIFRVPGRRQPQSPRCADRQTMELSESSLEAQRKHAEVLLQLEAQRRARALVRVAQRRVPVRPFPLCAPHALPGGLGSSQVVPTDPEETKVRLRELGEPVTLFGEVASERRDRLRRILAEQQVQVRASRRMQGGGCRGSASPFSSPLLAGHVCRRLAHDAAGAAGTRADRRGRARDARRRGGDRRGRACRQAGAFLHSSLPCPHRSKAGHCCAELRARGAAAAARARRPRGAARGARGGGRGGGVPVRGDPPPRTRHLAGTSYDGGAAAAQRLYTPLLPSPQAPPPCRWATSGR